MLTGADNCGQAEPDFERLHNVAQFVGPLSVLLFFVFIIILMLNLLIAVMSEVRECGCSHGYCTCVAYLAVGHSLMMCVATAWVDGWLALRVTKR